MTPASTLLLVLAAVFVLPRVFRYVMAARTYLTCAVEDVRAQPAQAAQLDPGELKLITLSDEQWLAAGFEPLGFATLSFPMTFFEGLVAVRVFHNERIPAYALVRRRINPERGFLIEAEISTRLSSGEELLTADVAWDPAFVPVGLHVEDYPGSSVAALSARHTERVAAISKDNLAPHDSLQRALDVLARNMSCLRPIFRERQWIVGTADPTLDRFTLRGAFSLGNYAIKRHKRPEPVSNPLPAVPETPPRPTLTDDLLVEADLQTVLHASEHPRTAPGVPWQVLSLLVAGAVLSYGIMALLFDPIYAALVLLTLTLHEGGHALAMRAVGYQNVRIFFIPFLGAVTIGRPAKTTVRGRLAVLLAGPVPGLWLAVLLFAVIPHGHQWNHWRGLAFVLLFLNALNMLPFTPLDGGRVLEVLTRPESLWRPVFHGFSAIGLLALYFYLHDFVLLVLGVGWTMLLRQQWQSYKLRRDVAAAIQDRSDFRGVARTVLEVVAKPPYGKFRSAIRQGTARRIARAFCESVVTGPDRVWGAIAYVTSWVPIAIALLLMPKP